MFTSWDLVHLPWIQIVGSPCFSTALWIGYQDRKWEWPESLWGSQSPTDSNLQYPHVRESVSSGSEVCWKWNFIVLLQAYIDSCLRLKLRQWPTWCTFALFYNTTTTILYMFRALHAHHQEVELYWCSFWYRPLSQWPSGAQVERELLCRSLSTCAPDDHWLGGG